MAPTAAVTAWPIRALIPVPWTSRLRTRRARRGRGMCHPDSVFVAGWLGSVLLGVM